jgi:hypothetical protein
LASQQVAREAIGDRQRVAVDAVFGFELAFEVGAPDLIGGSDECRGLAGMAEVAARSRLLNQAVTSKQVADGRARRPVALRITFAQELEEFLRAPGGVEAASIEQGFDQIGLGLMRAGEGLAGAVLQA